MKKPLLFLLLACLPLPAWAKLVTRDVDYADEAGTALQGYLAYDDAVSGKRPAVVVLPDWRGMTATPKERADMLAQLGYVAFVADIYGKSVRPQSVPEYVAQIKIYKGDRALYRERARAAYKELLRQPQADAARTAAIGYRFGGTGVVEMARDGLPLLGVVSFHGGLDAQPSPAGKAIRAKVLALCGADDPMQPAVDLVAFEKQLRDGGVDYQIVSYGHAQHAFTDKDVDALKIPGAVYDAKADRRSWQAMRDFFEELFAR